MSISINKLKSGMVVYDVHSERMGNTTVRTMGCWRVRIIEVDPEGRWVMASWNGNAAKKFHGTKFSWRAKEPVFIPTWGGYGKRLATREEIKAMKEAKK